ncbi:MAG: glycosyltransferase [Candidatus Aureabacteria bacterium]|nr:glycosyltransferase [Candidatus Auribacterota bacterium]
MFQTISKCNASCGFCPYPSVSPDLPHGRMEEDLFLKILDDCQPYQEHLINLIPGLMNEPLLDKQLIQKITIMKRRFPRACVHFLTNGSLIDEKCGDEILDSPLDWIGISFFGHTKASYESSMGLPYEKVRKYVEAFVKKAVAVRGPEFVMITFFKWNLFTEQEVKDEVAFWKDLGVMRISNHEGGISRAGNVPSIPAPVNQRMNSCHSIWSRKMMHILHNGDVVLCCMDWRRRHVLGNVREKSIHEIWHSADYEKIRNVIRGESPLQPEHLCSRCEMAVETKYYKIVMIHPHDIFSHKEPWTIRIKTLGRELAKMGHDVTLVTFTLDSFPQEPFVQDGMKIVSLSRKLSLVYFFKKIRILRQLIKDADIVHFQKAFYYCSVPSVISAWLEKKWIHYDWDDNETAIYFSGKKTSSYWTGYLLGALEWILPRVCDSVSVSSDVLMNKVLSYGIEKDRVVKIPVGADPVEVSLDDVRQIKERYHLNGDTQIYIGQLHGAQYAELLLHACRKLKENGKRIKTLIVGDGYDRRRLESLKDSLGLEEEVIFTGAVPHESIPIWLEAASVAIACFEKTKVTECKSPLKIAEYLCAGKAIVAHAVGEVPFMIGEAGICIDPDDPDSLWKALMSLHENKDTIKKLQAKARIQARQFTWLSGAEKLDRLFQKITLK